MLLITNICVAVLVRFHYLLLNFVLYRDLGAALDILSAVSISKIDRVRQAISKFIGHFCLSLWLHSAYKSTQSIIGI